MTALWNRWRRSRRSLVVVHHITVHGATITPAGLAREVRRTIEMTARRDGGYFG